MLLLIVAGCSKNPVVGEYKVDSEHLRADFERLAAEIPGSREDPEFEEVRDGTVSMFSLWTLSLKGDNTVESNMFGLKEEGTYRVEGDQVIFEGIDLDGNNTMTFDKASQSLNVKVAMEEDLSLNVRLVKQK